MFDIPRAIKETFICNSKKIRENYFDEFIYIEVNNELNVIVILKQEAHEPHRSPEKPWLI
jgi:hypothetical protein